MNECWAECLGDCSGKMSREHIFSEGVHFSDQINVQGFSWCLEKPVSVGLTNLTRKILCTKHNNELAIADSAATSAIKAFEEAIKLNNFRTRYRKTDWSRKDFTINGYELESWFLKTLINITFKSEKLIGSRATQPGTPPKELVEIAFQRRRFEPPAGLYTIPSAGETSALDGRIRVTVMSRHEPATLGAVFLFSGLRYFLYLNKDLRPGPENFRSHNDPVVSQTPFLYRLRKVKFPVHGRVSITISIRW